MRPDTEAERTLMGVTVRLGAKATEVSPLTPDSSSSPKSRSLASRSITAFSNFGVQYNYNAIAWAKLWIEALYGDPAWAEQLSSSAVFGGTLIGAALRRSPTALRPRPDSRLRLRHAFCPSGMLGMGYMGDAVGRRPAMVATLSVMAAGSLLSGLAPWGSDTAVWALLCASRFLIGIGAGGVYPLSAAKAVEDSGGDTGAKAQAAGWNLFWRNPAVLWVYLFGYILVLGIGAGAEFDMGQQAYNPSWDAAWRIHLAFGALPVLPLIWLAFREKESEEFQRAARRNPLEALKEGGWWRQMICTGGAWFCYDTAYYGNALLQPKIRNTMFPDDTIEVEALKNMGVGLSGVLFSLLAIWLLPLGTRQLQVGSFLFTAALTVALAAAWMPLGKTPGLQLFLYAMLYGSFWVSKITTYVLPSEVYRVEVRSTLNGMSAACGKLGAILGQVVFDSILRSAAGKSQTEQSRAVQRVLYVSVWFSLGGAVLTLIGLKVECCSRASARRLMPIRPMSSRQAQYEQVQ